MSFSALYPAVVTAGGRLPGELAARAGTTVKALMPVGETTCLARVVAALRSQSQVSTIVVVGPPEIESIAKAAGADRVLPEGETGPENMLRGLMAVRDGLDEGHALLCATDVVCLDADALDSLLSSSRDKSADIIFPVISREAYEGRFPNSPNTWAKIAGREYTGSSVQLIRPAALERNKVLIEQVFAARKSQWQMARLLGLSFALKFLLGTLTVPVAEARASALTGCRCLALMDADARLALDIDTIADYEYALALLRNANAHGETESANAVRTPQTG